MREQIEQLIADLEGSLRLFEAHAKRCHTPEMRDITQGLVNERKVIIGRLRAILASPDTVSAEKGADGSL